MKIWRQKPRPTRAELIDHKHQLEGEIRWLAAEVSRRRNRGAEAGGHEARLAKLRHQHHQTRLRIDRTP